jgi:hypothetical protein
MPSGRPDGRQVFWWMLGVTGTVMSALAILSLARHALILLAMSAPGELVMSAYAAVMRGLLGWAERPLQDTLSWLGGFVGTQPTLEAHWRDMLVMMAIWTGALVWARWRDFAARWSAAGHDGIFGFNHILAFAFAFLVLAAGSLLTVVVNGILPIRSYDLSVQLGIAVSPWLVFAVVVWVGGIVKRSEMRGVLILAGVAAFATWWMSQAVGYPAGLGIAGFAVSVIIMGAIYLILGLGLVASAKRFADSPAVHGLYILSGFVGAGVLWSIDWGLRRVFG